MRVKHQAIGLYSGWLRFRFSAQNDKEFVKSRLRDVFRTLGMNSQCVSRSIASDLLAYTWQEGARQDRRTGRSPNLDRAT